MVIHVGRSQEAVADIKKVALSGFFTDIVLKIKSLETIC